MSIYHHNYVLELIYFLCLLLQRWAVDLNQYACESLKLDHPEIEVDFLSLFSSIDI